jgi:hypothetical protein
LKTSSNKNKKHKFKNMIKCFFIITVFLFVHLETFGQPLGLTFKNAMQQNISIESLDSIYISAVHADTTLAVFKTEQEQEGLQKAYAAFLQSLGHFLLQNNFIWEKPTKSYNRIYFNSDGAIDYFLFNFLCKPENKPSEIREMEFEKLLNLFITKYRFPLTAKTKFAQCSPVTYMPQK